MRFASILGFFALSRLKSRQKLKKLPDFEAALHVSLQKKNYTRMHCDK